MRDELISGIIRLPTQQTRAYLAVALAAGAFLMVTMGVRQSFGLFVSPLNTSTGLGIATISFALAIGQFTWGAVQPIAGALADRYGPGKVLVAGPIILACGIALTPLMDSGFGLIISLGLLASIGSGAGSFSVLLGAASQRLPAESRGKAAGVVNAGGSLGQFVFAPVAQALISALGWMAALWALAAMTLAALPLVRAVAPRGTAAPAVPAAGESPWRAIGNAFEDRSYVLLNLGFFTCGFHIAFLVTHLPQEVNLCGLPPTVASWSLAIIGLANIAGSLGAGHATARSAQIHSRVDRLSRSADRALPGRAKTALTFYLSPRGLGACHGATDRGVVGKLFGVRFLATLFGMTLLSHQIGGFLGAWLGGLAFENTGSYLWMWYADMALAAAAAIVNLPIREATVPAPGARPAAA